MGKPFMAWLSFTVGRRFRGAALAVVATACSFTIGTAAAVGAPPARAGQEGIFALPGKLPKDLPRGPLFDYDLKWEQERFYLFVPPNYRGRERFGLIAFVHAGDQMNVPNDWKRILTYHKLLYIAPQKVGNEQRVPRRVLVTVAAIHKMMELYKVDPRRVYVTGHSGGGKVASLVAFTQPDLVRGALPMCAFLYPVTEPWATQELLDKVKSQVGFTLITGPKDFNHQAILAHYEHELVPAGYRAKLFDVPGMGHEIARGQTLSAALTWLEGRDATPDADQRAKSAKSKKSSLPTKASEE